MELVNVLVKNLRGSCYSREKLRKIDLFTTYNMCHTHVQRLIKKTSRKNIGFLGSIIIRPIEIIAQTHVQWMQKK